MHQLKSENEFYKTPLGEPYKDNKKKWYIKDSRQQPGKTENNVACELYKSTMGKYINTENITKEHDNEISKYISKFHYYKILLKESHFCIEDDEKVKILKDMADLFLKIAPAIEHGISLLGLNLYIYLCEDIKEKPLDLINPYSEIKLMEVLHFFIIQYQVCRYKNNPGEWVEKINTGSLDDIFHAYESYWKERYDDYLKHYFSKK